MNKTWYFKEKYILTLGYETKVCALGFAWDKGFTLILTVFFITIQKT